jgi:hypothetical protein
LAGGCFKISINPTCPATVSVGDTGDLVANEVDPGAIPTYLWEAFPATAVQIADPAVPTTTFEAMAIGEVTFRLLASDGLFQVVDTCRTQIATAPVTVTVTVTLVAVPQRLAQGESTLLTCTSTGATPAVSFVVDQLDGPLAELTTVSPGVAVAILNVAGDAVFRCIGTDADANSSDPALVTVTVTRPSRPGGGIR